MAGTQPLNTFILQPRCAEVDKLNIVTEFPCLLGLTVQILPSGILLKKRRGALNDVAYLDNFIKIVNIVIFELKIYNRMQNVASR